MRFGRKPLIIIAFLIAVAFLNCYGCKNDKDIDAEQSSSVLSENAEEAKAVLKRYYIKNAKYDVPYIYNDKSSFASAVKIIANGNSELTVTDGTFTVPACESLTFKFTTPNGEVIENRQVIDVNFGSSLKMDKYFIADGGIITAEKRNLTFKSNAEDVTYKFINEIDLQNFSLQFKIPDDMGYFSKITFTLSDYLDASKSSNIEISNVGGQAQLSVNGKNKKFLNRAFADSSKTYGVALNNGKLKVGEVSTTVGGLSNTSFGYLVIAVQGAQGDAVVEISSLNLQPLNNYSADVFTPNVFFTGAYGGEITKGNTYRINPVYAVDVLDPFTEINFSVRTPSGEYVKAKDGTELNNVSALKTYEFIADEYGQYSCSYSYKDTFGNSDRFIYSVDVLDEVKPTITVEKSVIKGVAGEAFNVPNYEVSDNYSSTDKIKVTIQVIDCDYKLSTVKDGEQYVPTKKGVYTIRYMAMDENSNLSFAEVVVVVS